jgi:excisionase family DNA binding protein
MCSFDTDGAVITQVAVTDTAALRRALDEGAEKIDVRLTLPRDLAHLVLRLIEAQGRGGAVVVPARSELTPNEAAAILGVSRPQVYKLIEDGRLAHRMVGTHRRIPVASVTAFHAEQQAAQRAAMNQLTALSNDLGLID